MSQQQPGGEFRGRIQNATWSWGQVADDHRRLPLFGIFLVVLGGVLLIEQIVPGAQALGSAIVVAVGVALLVAWAVNRQVWQLYAGAILTALALPSLLQDLNVINEGGGWGTLFLGVAFLAIAAIRAASGGGFGWQAVLGVVLAVVGGSQIGANVIPNFPSLDKVFWPVIILVLGVLLVARGLDRGRRSA